MSRWTLFPMLVLVAGCGSAPDPAPVTPAAAKARSGKAGPKDAALAGLPARCEKKRWPCLPPRRWVSKLCDDVYPDVALHMFAPDTPWQRFYMLQNADPFNASGGASLMGDKMRRGEEVIALKRNNAKDGVVTSDIGGYDVLRWNGACATVHDGEFATKPLREIGHAHFEWREIGLPTRLALEADPDVSATYEEKRRQCRGITLGRVSAGCEEYDKKLVDEVVRYVRNGGKLPKPARAP